MAVKCLGTLVVGVALLGITGCQDSKVQQTAPASASGSSVTAGYGTALYSSVTGRVWANSDADPRIIVHQVKVGG